MDVLWLIALFSAVVILPDVTGTPIMGAKLSYSAQLHKYKVVCYLGSWAVYRPEPGKFPIEKIDPYICTHLIYGFAGLGFDSKIKSLDPYYDLEENYGKGAFKRFTGLKHVNPELKTLLAIGGWNEGSVKYSTMAASPASRKIFVDSVVEFLTKYDFDGLDLDWEYPGSRGGKPEDKANFVALLRETKEAFSKHGLLLTAAVSAGKHFADPAYDIPKVSEYLDFINVMCYDYHGGWETFAGHHASLYPRPDETPGNQTLNVNFSINYWISKGASPEKLVLGMGLYGRSFTLRRAEDHGLYDEAPQRGRAGPYTREPGSLGYNEICEMQKREQWTVVRDPYYMAPYAYKERQWVGYDDMESITHKVAYAKNMKLGGGMVWSIETDDFQGTCHGQKYPMLTTINKAFAGEIQPMPMPPDAPPVASTEPTAGTSPSSTSPTTKEPTMMPSPSTEDHHHDQTTPEPSSTTPFPLSTVDTLDNVAKNFTCTSDGLHRHPVNCQVFFSCVRVDNEKFKAYRFTCPSGTYFSTTSSTCTFPANVPECKLFFLQKYGFLRPYYFEE